VGQPCLLRPGQLLRQSPRRTPPARRERLDAAGFADSAAADRKLSPAGDARQALAEGDQRMVEDGLLLDDAKPFDALLQRCQALALKAPTAVPGGRA
jgi:hypothetical protein